MRNLCWSLWSWNLCFLFIYLHEQSTCEHVSTLENACMCISKDSGNYLCFVGTEWGREGLLRFYCKSDKISFQGLRFPLAAGLDFFVVLFWNRVSRSSPGCPRTHYIDQVGPECTEICLPLPPNCWGQRCVPPCLAWVGFSYWFYDFLIYWHHQFGSLCFIWEGPREVQDLSLQY